MPNHKLCNKCEEVKSFDNFSKDNHKKNGLQSYCKECCKKIHRKYTDKYAKKYKKTQKLYKKKWGNKKAKYKTSASQSISWHDYTECSEDGYLIVNCKYCGKKFIPRNSEVENRSYVLNIKGTDTQGFYCSSGCKKACPSYWRVDYHKGQKVEGSSREVQPELRQMCLARDEYTCKKCNEKGKTVQLHCHHIYPLNESPITSADVDDCITLCKSCHKEAHKIAGCTYNELKC